MRVRVATFNLNNLFSRFNFEAEVGQTPEATGAGGLTLTFEAGSFRARTFMGRLVRAKDPAATAAIAQRIAAVIDADVLAVQEVEHIEILRAFNREHLHGMYPHVCLVEGNDQRLIDVGILSRLPIGDIVSHQSAVHPDAPDERVFSRDLLQVEILDARRKPLFTIYNTHLKSNFVPFGRDPDAGARAANLRRTQQAETIARILSRQERPDTRFVLTGDMNDDPDAPTLAAFRSIDGQPLIQALEKAQETRPSIPETPGQGSGPATPVWTHRFNPSGPAPAEYRLFDHIWLSQSLADRFESPMIERRTKHGGNGSDHDPAWVDLQL